MHYPQDPIAVCSEFGVQKVEDSKLTQEGASRTSSTFYVLDRLALLECSTCALTGPIRGPITLATESTSWAVIVIKGFVENG